MSKNLNKAIWEVLRKRMESLSWKCGECEKMFECEEHATTDDKWGPVSKAVPNQYMADRVMKRMENAKK